jgi:hypothetical protein
MAAMVLDLVVLFQWIFAAYLRAVAGLEQDANGSRTLATACDEPPSGRHARAAA